MANFDNDPFRNKKSRYQFENPNSGEWMPNGSKRGVYDDQQQPNTGTDAASQNELNHLTGNSPESANDLRHATGNDDASRAENARNSGDSEGASFYNKKADEEGDAGYPYRQEQPGATSKLRGSLGNLSKKKKLWLAGGAVGSAGLLIGVIIAILFISSLLVPNLAKNIVAYQAVRMSRLYAQTQDNVIGGQFGADATDDATQTGIRAAVKRAGQKASNTYNNVMDKLSIQRGTQKAIDNLVSNRGFQTTVKRSLLGNERLLGVTLNSTTHLKVKPGLIRFVPGLNSIFSFNNDVTFSKTFAPALDASLRADGVGPIIRWFVTANIRRELGIGLVAWNVGKFQGKSAEQAQVELKKEEAQAVDQPGAADNAVTDDIKKADSDAKAAAQAAINNPAEIAAAINNGGILSSVSTAIGSALAKTGVKAVVGFVSPWYEVFLYICTIFDGSLDRSGPTINNRHAQGTRIFYHIATSADEQEYGNYGGGDIGPAIQATANDLNANNDLINSNALRRASGLPVNTTNTPPTESSADGEYTLLNASIGSTGIPGSTLLTNIINRVGNRICPTLTNLYFAGGAAALQLAIAFFTGGTSQAAGDAAGAAAKQLVQTEATNILTRFIAKIGATKILASRLTKFLGKTVISVAGLAAITIVTHEIVLARAQQLESGFAQGSDEANIGDAGGNAHFNEICQNGLFCRPLTKAELSQTSVEDANYSSYLNGQKSNYQRYFAFSNPDSLATKLSLSMYGDIFGRHIFSTLSSVVNRLFNPVRLVGDILSPLSNKPALAATEQNTDSQYYGNVQFGESTQEESLSKEPAYAQFQNQMILDATNKESSVSSTYGHCFSDQIGDLLSSGKDIIRDGDANVIANQGTCSPDNLGENNPDYCYSVNVVDLTTISAQNPNGTVKNYSGCDLVFRWRLAQAYNNVCTNLLQMANQDTTAQCNV